MHPDFADATQMLPVPRTAGPSRGRGARGRCVWCGKEATLSLGPRLKTINGALHRWIPRGCEDCVRHQAALTHHIHRSSCARCTKWEHCLDSRALYDLAHGQPGRLIREA